MFRSFSGAGADDVWLQIADGLRCGSGVLDQSSRGGPTREILHAAISVANPRSRWVISRTPAINPAYAFAELVWTLTGRNDSAFLTFFNSRLPALAGNGPTFHGSYGRRLCHNLGFDQFGRAYKALKHCPESRQIVLQIWDGRIDFPGDDGQPVSLDIPCNLVAMLKVRNGRLEWTQVMRSNDVFRGIPYDFVQFTCMQEIFAGWLGVEMGAYCHLSDSLHAYVADLPKVLVSAAVASEVDTSNLRLPFEDSHGVFGDLARSIERIIDSGVPSSALLAGLKSSALPVGYHDMLAVLTAEGIRIRKEARASSEAIEQCQNPLYRQLWLRWADRVTSKVAG